MTVLMVAAVATMVTEVQGLDRCLRVEKVTNCEAERNKNTGEAKHIRGIPA